MSEETLCSLCGKGHLTPRTECTVTEYRGQKGNVTLHFSECDACGSEIVREDESRINKRAVLSFKKTVDHLLTGKEIRAIREKYQITQAQAAKLFGGGPVAFSKYENDDIAHSDAMDNLLRLVRLNESNFWALVEEKQLEEILKRRPPRIMHYASLEPLQMYLTIREEKSAPTTHQLSYSGPHSKQYGVSQWMQ